MNAKMNDLLCTCVSSQILCIKIPPNHYSCTLWLWYDDWMYGSLSQGPVTESRFIASGRSLFFHSFFLFHMGMSFSTAPPPVLSTQSSIATCGVVHEKAATFSPLLPLVYLPLNTCTCVELPRLTGENLCGHILVCTCYCVWQYSNSWQYNC